MVNDPMVPGGQNPFEKYAARVDSQTTIGMFLKFTKGDWLVGRDGEECPEKELVALLPGMVHGWVRWEDNYPVEHNMGMLMESFVPPTRETLSHNDQSKWETSDKGAPRDPWQQTVYLPMITINAETMYTFTTSSDGGRRHAITPLCREYGARIRQYPDEFPVVGLEQDSYLHPDRSIGRVKYPLLPPRRWVKAEPYLAAVTALTGRSLKLLSAA